MKFWFYYGLLKIVNVFMRVCLRMYYRTYKEFWCDSYRRIERNFWRKIFNKCADEIGEETLKYNKMH